MWAIWGKKLDENKKLVNNITLLFTLPEFPHPSWQTSFVKAARREAG